MPYIAADQRQALDPLIDIVVQFVRKNCDWTTDKFNYLNWIKYVLCEFALDLLRPRLSPMFNPFGSPMARPEIIDLKKIVFALAEKINELAQGPSRAENLAGLFNYSCTQILFLTMPPKRYWSLNAVRSACLRVAFTLHHYANVNDSEADLLIGVLAGDILDESYRRVMAGYEDEKILQNGDVSSYENQWAPVG